MNDALAENEESLSRVEQVYRTIRERILSNEFPAGYQALEPEIAKQLGVSRTPVREALIRLEAECLIELIPRRGMRVLPLAPEEFFQVSQVAIALEVMAVSILAQEKPGKDFLAPLNDALVAMDLAVERDCLDEWSRAAEKFSRLLSNLCGNDCLARLVESVRAQTYRSRMMTLKMRPNPAEANEACRNVYNAILAGDVEKACQVMRSHKTTVLGLLMEVLEQYRLPHL